MPEVAAARGPGRGLHLKWIVLPPEVELFINNEND